MKIIKYALFSLFLPFISGCGINKSSQESDNIHLQELMEEIKQITNSESMSVSIEFYESHIRSIGITNKALNIIPRSLSKFQYLESLTITDAQLIGEILLPEMNSLKNLSLQGDRLSFIPSFSLLPKLEAVDLSLNNIEGPQVVDLCSNIKTIKLNFNPITNIVLQNGSKLEELCLNMTQINEIDSSIYQLQHLKYLELFNFHLTEINISDLNELEYLKIKGDLIRNNKTSDNLKQPIKIDTLFKDLTGRFYD
jgi:hypothetical protein